MVTKFPPQCIVFPQAASRYDDGGVPPNRRRPPSHIPDRLSSCFPPPIMTQFALPGFPVITGIRFACCPLRRGIRLASTILLLLSLAAPRTWAVPDQAAGSSPDPIAAPDWQMTVFSDQVKNATALCVDDAGRIYVTETYRWRVGIEDNRDHTYWIMDDLACETVEDRAALYVKWQNQFEENYFTRYSDRVVRLEDQDRDGRADELLEFAADFDESVEGPAIGLLYGNDSVYLTCVPNLWRLTDKDQDGVAETREVLATGFGVKNSLSGHDLHGLTWGPDGKLYFSMGDRGFHVTTREGVTLADANSGAVFRCNPDGSELELFYHQLRNPQELAFNEYGDLFTVDNNCDQGDAARICYLLEGGNSGWHLGAQAQTTYAAHIQDGGLQQVPHWLSEGLWKLRFDDQPTHILPPIGHLTNGPSGLTFHSGIGFSDDYQNHFLVCDYRGAPNQCFLYSFHVNQAGAGYDVAKPHVVRDGVPMTDVEVGYDGKLYVSDFGGGWKRSDQGNIYALFDAQTIGGKDVHELTQLFAQGFSQRSSDELLALLAHPEMRVRLRSQYELAGRGAEEIAGLVQVAQNAANSFARYHAIWALGQLRADDALLRLTADSDAEIRAQAARTLGNRRSAAAIPVLVSLLNDAAARPRTFAAIALGKLDASSATEAVLAFVERNNDQDPFERHAGVFALSRIASGEQLAGLASHPHVAVRRAAILALRRNRDPLVAAFLQDDNGALVSETLRAVNDETLSSAFPAAADFVRRQLESGQIAESPASELIFRRMVNVCFRAGRPEDANTLARLSGHEALPESYRLIALRALRHLDAPPPIDATLGLYRPLAERDRSAYAPELAAALREMAETSHGELAALAIETLGHYRLALEPTALLRRIRDPQQSALVRQVSLEQLFRNARPEMEALLRQLLMDDAPEIRRTAAAALVRQNPRATAEVAQVLLEKETTEDYRAAFQILSPSTDPDSGRLLIEQLDRITNNQLPADVRLDGYEAALKNPQTAVQAKREWLDTWLADRDQSPYEFTRDGGNPQRGRAVFQNQGVCLKCHQADRGGGEAGPSLAEIGRQRRSDELLQSILEPNAVVVPGYGTVTLYLDDGSVLNGTPVNEDDQMLTLRSPTGDTQTISKATIEEMSPVTSPMPQQAQNLTRQELRDLIAYLKQLQGPSP